MPTFTLSVKDPDTRVIHNILGNHYAPAALDALFESTYPRLASRTRTLLQSPELSVQSVTWGGIHCMIHYWPSDINLDVKRDCLREMLEHIQGVPEMQLPGNHLDVYMLSNAWTSMSSDNNASAGYVHKAAGSAPGSRTFSLILGESVTKKSEGMRIAAEDVYDYYSGTFNDGALKARTWRRRAVLYHELGHFLHQIHHPQHFWFNQAIVDLNLRRVTPANNPFIGTPSGAAVATELAVKKYASRVSVYASTHPNEMVAETFSMLMVGIPLTPDHLAAYSALGGYVPPPQIRYVREEQPIQRRRIRYPFAASIPFISEMAARIRGTR